MAHGSKGQILPCCIRLLLDYLLSSLSVKHTHYLHNAYVCLEFCLSHFLSGDPLVPRGLLMMVSFVPNLWPLDLKSFFKEKCPHPKKVISENSIFGCKQLMIKLLAISGIHSMKYYVCYIQ